jgi:hypothetical protein
MPLFGQSKGPAEVEAERARQQANLQRMIDAAGAMSQWVRGVPAGDLAAHLMPAFGPGAPARSRNGAVSLSGLFQWLGYRDNSMIGPILEGVQLLEHAELILIGLPESDSGPHYWSATRFGLATLAEGKDAVRQRIKDRTGL